MNSILVCDLEFKVMDSGSALLAIRSKGKESQENVLLTAFVKVCICAPLEAYLQAYYVDIGTLFQTQALERLHSFIDESPLVRPHQLLVSCFKAQQASGSEASG